MVLTPLVQKGMHFVCVLANIYCLKVLEQLPLPQNCQVAEQWKVLADERILLGSNWDKGQAMYRKLTYQQIATQEQLVLFTDLFTSSAQHIFEAYHRRWRIEVIFRWLKSEFALDTIPAFNEAGVWAWIYVNLIAFLLLQYWYQQDHSLTSWRSWSARDAFGWFWQSYHEAFFVEITTKKRS